MTMLPTETLSKDTEAVADSLSAIVKREQLTTPSTKSCHHVGYLNPSDPTMITADDRKRLVDWCYNFVDFVQISRELVASAMEMVDRFLGNPADFARSRRVSDEALRDQTKFQLLTVTAMYLAIKVNERVALSSRMFAEMCRHAYTAEDIEDMERLLLSGLSWRCHAPTAHQVGLSILSLIFPFVKMPDATWGILIDEVKYLTELAVLDCYVSAQRTSTIAVAAIHNVISDSVIIKVKGHQELLLSRLKEVMENFDFDHSKQITEVRIRLQSLLLLHEEVDGEERFLDDISSSTERSSGSIFNEEEFPR